MNQISKNIRKSLLKAIASSSSSHSGSALSIVDILAVLYFKVLNVNPKEPNKKDRDRFISSKGHGSVAMYATLAERGFFEKELLTQLSELLLLNIVAKMINVPFRKLSY
jgi:transketolase